MQFEWDEEKNELNKRKHDGISFEIASRVFLDPYLIEIYDEKHSDDEDRSIAIGEVHKVLYVVFTERGEKKRIISARQASKTEEMLYYGNRNLYT